MAARKTVGIGIVGFGSRGISLARPILDSFSTRAQFVGFCENNPRKVDAAKNWIAANCPDQCTISDNLENFLKLPGLDLVMICTPQYTHMELACSILSAGKNLFLEKPMACNVAECDSIIEARDNSGKELFMGFNLRNHATCKKIKELIDNGAVGKPQTLICTDFYSGGMTYFRRWHRLHKYSGGLIVEKGCHSFDLINWYLGARPKTVAAFGGLDIYKPRKDASTNCRDCSRKSECPYYVDVFDKKHKVDDWGHNPDLFDLCIYNSDKDTFDNHSVLIEYENGCRASYVESFASCVKERSGRQFTINGPDGQIWADLSKNVITVYKTHNFLESKGHVYEYTIPPEPGGHGGADIHMISFMLDCIEGRKKNVLYGEIGREAVLVAQAAEIAAKEKRVVDISGGKLVF